MLRRLADAEPEDADRRVRLALLELGVVLACLEGCAVVQVGVVAGDVGRGHREERGEGDRADAQVGAVGAHAGRGGCGSRLNESNGLEKVERSVGMARRDEPKSGMKVREEGQEDGRE